MLIWIHPIVKITLPPQLAGLRRKTNGQIGASNKLYTIYKIEIQKTATQKKNYIFNFACKYLDQGPLDSHIDALHYNIFVYF
jgi:hypothetical protein